MGFKNSERLLKFLREISRDSFRYVTSDANEIEKMRKKGDGPHYNIVKSAKTPADVACIDFPGIDHKVLIGAKIGHEVTQRIARKLNGIIDRTGAKILVVCMEDRALVPIAKQAEQNRRRSSRSLEPYGSDLPLSTGQVVPLDRYEFASDLPLPAQYQRLLMTPALIKKYKDFVVDFLRREFVPDACRPITVVVSGVSVVDSGETKRAAISTYYTGKIEPSVSTLLPSALIGEAECQCVHWILRFLEERDDVNSGFLCVNDSDAFASVLLNMHRVLASSSGATIWLDFSAPRCVPRFVELVDVWRSIMRWTSEKVLPPRRQHDPIGALMVAAYMNGGDYVTPIAGMGESTILDTYLKRPEVLAGSSPRNPSATVVLQDRENCSSVSMFVAENKLYDLLWGAVTGRPGFGAVLESLEKQRNMHGLRFTERIDVCADAVELQNAKLAAINSAIKRKNGGRKSKDPGYVSTKRLIVALPGYRQMRAWIRRCVWTVYYFRNAPVRGYIPRSEAFCINGVSVYGFTAHKTPGVDKPVCSLAQDVCTPQVIAQPFISQVAKPMCDPVDEVMFQYVHDDAHYGERSPRLVGKKRKCSGFGVYSGNGISADELEQMAELIGDPHGSFCTELTQIKKKARHCENRKQSPSTFFV